MKMKDTYNIKDYQHMASGHNTATIDVYAQCEVGRDLVKLGKTLVGTSQDIEGLEATLLEMSRIRSLVVNTLAAAKKGGGN